MTQKLTSLYRDKHVISASNFNQEDLRELFYEIEDIRACLKTPDQRTLLRGHLQDAGRHPYFFRILSWEPSLRTITSFEDAIRLLGGESETTYDAGKFSSVSKGESVAKTIRMIGNRCRGIIIRHDGKQEQNALTTAADACQEYDLQSIIINAGEANLEHPTQALLDYYTIFERHQEILNGNKELHYGFAGDISDSRTVHSLLLLMRRCDTKSVVYCIAEEGDTLPEWLMRELDGENLTLIFTPDILQYADIIDVWYFTRYQFERKINIEKMTPEEKGRTEEFYARKFGWSEQWARLAKPNAICLHPLPHGKEFPQDPENYVKSVVERDPRFIHLRQADNGVLVRMALLKLLFPRYGKR